MVGRQVTEKDESPPSTEKTATEKGGTKEPSDDFSFEELAAAEKLTMIRLERGAQSSMQADGDAHYQVTQVFYESSASMASSSRPKV